MKLIMTTGVTYTGGGIYTVWGVAEDTNGQPLFFDTGVDGLGYDPVIFYSKYPYETDTDCFPSYVPIANSEAYVVDCYAPGTTAHHNFWMQIFKFCKDTDVQDVGNAIRDALMERLRDETDAEHESKVKEIMNTICELLPHTNDRRIWSDGEEILCETKQLAEHIADLIDAMYGGQVVNTGYYDHEEDKRNNEVANNTGFWYVTID